MKMKTFKKAVCLVICFCILFSFASCKEKGRAAMTLGSTVISEGAYQYWVCSYKAQFMNQYSDMSDSDEFWGQVLYDGVTAEEFLTDLVNEYVKMNLVSMYLFDKYGMKISSEDEKVANGIVSEFKEISGDDAKAFEKILSQYGVNEKTLKQIYLDEFKSTYVYNYVFENGIATVTYEEKQDFLENNYVRIRHIYINNSYNYDESSYDSDGNFIKVPLDEETKAKQDAKVESVRKALSSGEDFDEVYEKYSEETAYKNGYYICSKTEDLPSELIVKSFTLETGESCEFESEYGTHFIKRLEMDEGAWKSTSNEDFFTTFTDDVYENVFMELMRSYFDEITVNEEVINEYPIRDALPNWSYQY